MKYSVESLKKRWIQLGAYVLLYHCRSRGQVSWAWDPAPETQFRYSVRIPVARVREDPSPYRVIDYLIVEPDPRKITRAELSELMARVYAIGDPARAAAALDAEKDRLRYFTDTSWNVKARQE